MKLIIIKESNLNLKKDRYIVNFNTKDKIQDIATIGLLEESKDFDLNDKLILISNYESYQLRPKALYKNNKGIYYKKSIGRGWDKKQEIYYLDSEEVDELNGFIKELIK